MKCRRIENILTFTFDGEAPVVFDSAKCPALDQDARMHGYEQKIRDNAAIARKQKDGTVITVTEAMRRAEVLAMINHLESNGSWNTRVAAAPKQNQAILDLATQLGKTYAETEAIIASGDLSALVAQ